MPAIKFKFTKMILLFSTLTIVSCNDDDFSPEQLTKLRPLGAAPAGDFSGDEADQAAAITLHFAAPKNSDNESPQLSADDFSETTIGITVFGQRQTLIESSDISIEVSSDFSYASIDYYQATLNFSLPNDQRLQVLKEVDFRTTLKFRNETITSKGRFKAYSEAVDLSRARATMSIPSPGPLSANSKGSIKAVLDKANGEVYRISWLVPNGKLSNRRALSTQWKPEATGAFTIISTARGRESGAFAIAIADITVN